MKAVDTLSNEQQTINKLKQIREIGKQVPLAATATATATTPSITHNKQTVVKEKQPPLSSQEEYYIAATQFMGYRQGYVFKTDTLGLGYYRDERYATSTATTTATSVSPKAIPPIEYKKFPYEFRQTLNSISMIIQLPHILSNSVQIHYTLANNAQQHRIHIAFKQQPSEAVEGDSSNSSGIQYGMQFELMKCVDITQCKHDVASMNMIVIMHKLKEEHWLSSVEKQDVLTALTYDPTAFTAEDLHTHMIICPTADDMEPSSSSSSSISVMKSGVDVDACNVMLSNMIFSVAQHGTLYDLD